MLTSAFVNLWGQRLGAVYWDNTQGVAYFEYSKNSGSEGLEPSPILMPAFQNTGRVYSFWELNKSATFRGLPGLLADVLPDKYGNALINAWLSKQGRSIEELSPLEILCFIGKRGMGALEFEPVLTKETATASKIEIESLIQISEAILTNRQHFLTNLNLSEERALLDILKIGTSAGGARAKAVIAFNPITLEIRSGQAEVPENFEHWLIKFDGVSDSQFGASFGYGRVEMAYYLMALDCGIEMNECRLLEENGRAHFITKRFDRLAANEKLHYQSFCAMRHFDFNEVGYFSYEQLFETLRMLRLPYPQAEQLYRRMVFNVLARNCDDHTKNFGFLMDKTGVWKLAPAFDVCHAYRPDSPWVSMQSLSVNGKRTNITKTDLLEVAKNMNIKKANDIALEIASVVEKWSDYATKTGVDSQLSQAIQLTLLKL